MPEVIQSKWFEKGLRAKYRPTSEAGRGLIGAAPWLDALLLLGFFFLLSYPFVLQPGISVELPSARFERGSPYGRPIFIILQKGAGQGTVNEVVFFDDNRFRLDDSNHVDKLKKSFAELAKNHPETPLVVEADKRVQHGTIVKVLNIITEAGIKEVNLATQPVLEEGSVKE